MLSARGVALMRARLARSAWQRGVQGVGQARHQASAAAAAVGDQEGLARQMADALTIEEARDLWQAAQRADRPPSVDVLNAYLGKRVNMTKRTRRIRDARQHFRFVEESAARGVAPNLATYSILAQLVRDAAYAEAVPPNEQEAQREFLVDGANRICCSIIASMTTAKERKAQGPILLHTCTKWLQTYTPAKCLALQTYATALQAFGRHLPHRHVLRILKLCRAEYPVDAGTRPLYVQLYSSAAHNLFAAQQYKRLLLLFFDMHNSSIGPVPPVLAYCALHLCSVLQPQHTPALFAWLATGTSADARMYRYLLDSHARRQDVEGMFRVLEEMGRRGVPPTAEVFATVLAALRRRAAPGDASRLLEMYAAMRKQSTDVPTTYGPYEAALWAVDQLEPGEAPDGAAPAQWRQRVLADAKQDGHRLFWFQHA